MAEIVRDIAPGADILFHSGFNSEADFADGITELRACGADVLVDNLIYLDEPMFQDGAIAQAAEAAIADGALYFSSAGNDGEAGIDEFYVDGNPALDNDRSSPGFVGVDFHDFGGGSVNRFASFAVPAGCGATLILQWNDPFSGSLGPGASADLDFYLYKGILAEQCIRSGGDTDCGDVDDQDGVGITWMLGLTAAFFLGM